MADTIDRIVSSLAEDDAPSELSDPLRALWWLKKGKLETGSEWNRAHEICQSAEGTRSYDLVHGLAHWIEGDFANADYWYRRAGARRAGSDTGEEWQRLVAELG